MLLILILDRTKIPDSLSSVSLYGGSIPVELVLTDTVFVAVIFHHASQICSNFCFLVAAHMLPMWGALGQWRKWDRQRQREEEEMRDRDKGLTESFIQSRPKEVQSWRMHHVLKHVCGWMYICGWDLQFCLFLCVLHDIFWLFCQWLCHNERTRQANAAADEYGTGFATHEKLAIWNRSGIEDVCGQKHGAITNSIY